MKILMIGVGGVGEAMAIITQKRPWIEQIVLADYSRTRLSEIQIKLADHNRFPIEWVDARDQKQIEALAGKYSVDLIMNACDPVYNVSIFEAAFNY